MERLFHGTSKDAAHAIVADGFRLPTHGGMFGAGIYFADTPLKSLQCARPAPRASVRAPPVPCARVAR